MIRSWRHKGLKELFETGRSKSIRQDQKARITRRLDALSNAADVEELNIPGFGLHKLNGKPVRWAIDVNGPWRITFEWRNDGAYHVDLEQYH